MKSNDDDAFENNFSESDFFDTEPYSEFSDVADVEDDGSDDTEPDDTDVCITEFNNTHGKNRFLTDEEIMEEIHVVLTSDDEDKRNRSFEKIWQSVEPFIHHYLSRYHSTYVSTPSKLAIFMNEQSSTLYEYLAGYDPQKSKFITYVRGWVCDEAFRRGKRLLYGGSSDYYENKINNIERILRKNGYESVNELTVAEICSLTHESTKTVEECVAIIRARNPVLVEPTDTFGDFLATQKNSDGYVERSTEDKILEKEKMDHIRKSLKKLTPVQRGIFTTLANNRNYPIDQIAKKYETNSKTVLAIYNSAQSFLLNELKNDPLFAQDVLTEELDDIKNIIPFITPLSESEKAFEEDFLKNNEIQFF